MIRSRALLALGAALVAVGPVPAMAGDPLRVTKPVQATKFDLAPGRTYLPAYLAIDPDNKLNVAAAFAEVRSKRCGLMVSRDGGQTWVRRDASPALSTYPYCLMGNSHTWQGKVLWGRDGTLYYAMAGWDDQDGGERNGNLGIFLGRSTDFGERWNTVPVAEARGRQGADIHNNRPISGFAVDTRSGSQDVVSVTWRRQFRGTAAPNVRANQATVAVSADGGKTFPNVVELSPLLWRDGAKRQGAVRSTTTIPGATTTTAVPGSKAANPDDIDNYGGSNPTVAIDGKGTIYVVWVTSYANFPSSPLTAHFLARSTDKGKTWTTSQLTPLTRENSNGFGSMILQWSPEGGSQGTLHLVYEGNKQPDVRNIIDIFYRRSTDGGKTWTEAKALNDDDPKLLTFSGFPNLVVAPNGRLDVAFFDTRDDPGTSVNDVYYTSSTDNGTTWSKNVRVTDQSINRRIGPFASNFDLNAPPGLASTDEYALVSWDDTRFGDATTETQDVFVSALQYEKIGGTSRGPTLVLWGFVGLLGVGVLLVALAMVSRRRAAGPPRTPSEPREAQPIG